MDNNTRKILAISAISIALAIALGAYNAHGMEKLVETGKIDSKYIATFHTGVLYQFINSLGLMLLGILHYNQIIKHVKATILILIGMLIFSFSLYILSFHQILGSNFKILGAITPVGGLCMIVGWVWTGYIIYSKK